MADDVQKAETKTEEKASPAKSLSNPLIFISHDTRDAELAEAVSKLLSSVSCGMLKCFRSSDKKGSQGIEYGLEWYPELMKKLNASAGVLCLLTERSLNRPWILFEAGVAKGKLDTPVHGIAFGISLSQANTGPFAQFQNSDDDEESLTNVVMQLLTRIPGSEPDRETVLSQVRGFIERKDGILKALGESSPDDAGSPESSAARLFEEVKIIVQDLPSKLEGRIAEAVEMPRRRRLRRFHPRMLEELFIMSEEVESPVAILMVFSLFKEDYPWLYEIGRELHDAIRRKDAKSAEETYHEFRRLMEFSEHHPFFEDSMMSRSKQDHILFRELPRIVDRYMRRVFVGK